MYYLNSSHSNVRVPFFLVHSSCAIHRNIEYLDDLCSVQRLVNDFS